MKNLKYLSRILGLILVCFITAVPFTGCFGISGGRTANDGRISVKQVLQYFPDGLCAVQNSKGDNKGKWGYINKKGVEVIELKYDYVDSFISGAAVVGFKLDGGKDEYFMINTKGNIISEKYDNIVSVQYDESNRNKVFFKATKIAASETSIYSQNNSVIYLDSKGKELFSSKASEISGAVGEVVIVNDGKSSDKKYGAVNILTNKEILRKGYDYISEIDSYGKYNYMGIPIERYLLTGEKIDNRMNYGLATLSGKIIAEEKYLSIGDFHNGVAQVKIDDDLYGFINTKGETLFTKDTEFYSYYYRDFDSKGVLIYGYYKDSKSYSVAVDKKGNVLVEVETTDGYSLEHNSDSDFIVKTKTVSGNKTLTVYNLKGKEIISVEDNESKTYGYVEAYSHFGLSATERKGETITVKTYNKSGKEIGTIVSDIPQNSSTLTGYLVDSLVGFFNAEGFGNTIIKGADGKYSANIVNVKGKTIIEGAYVSSSVSYSSIFKDCDYIPFVRVDLDEYLNAYDDFVKGGYISSINDLLNMVKTGYMNSKGKIIVEAKQNSVTPDIGGSSLFAARTAYGQDGKWGFVDKSGEFVIEAKYSAAYYFMDGLALVQNDDRKWGFVNTKGREVVECKYAAILALSSI